MEISMVKVIKAKESLKTFFNPTYRSGGGRYGLFSYKGILRKVKIKIYYDEIIKVDYINRLKCKISGSYPIDHYPLDIGIITKKSKYFIPVKQFSRKQAKMIYIELSKRTIK